MFQVPHSQSPPGQVAFAHTRNKCIACFINDRAVVMTMAATMRNTRYLSAALEPSSSSRCTESNQSDQSRIEGYCPVFLDSMLPHCCRSPLACVIPVQACKPTFTTLEKDLAQGQHHAFLCGGSLVIVQQSWLLRADAEILSS